MGFSFAYGPSSIKPASDEVMAAYFGDDWDHQTFGSQAKQINEDIQSTGFSLESVPGYGYIRSKDGMMVASSPRETLAWAINKGHIQL